MQSLLSTRALLRRLSPVLGLALTCSLPLPCLAQVDVSPFGVGSPGGLALSSRLDVGSDGVEPAEAGAPASDTEAPATDAEAPAETAAPTAPSPEPAGDAATPAATDDPGAEGTAPEPGEGDDYASSKDAGTAMSGEETKDDDLPENKEQVGKEKKKPKSLSHLKTGSISVAPGFGYGMRTGGDKFCGEFSSDPTDSDGRKPLCTGLSPAYLDISLGYGVANRIDLVLGVRVNLQKRDYDNSDCGGAETCLEGKGLFVDSLGIGVLPGIRIWGGEVDKIVKFGGAVDFFYMYENFDGYRNRPTFSGENENAQARMDNRENEAGVSDHVIGLRGGPILQIDPHHNVGIFLIPAALPTFRPSRPEARDRDSGWFEIGFDLQLGIQARFP